MRFKFDSTNKNPKIVLYTFCSVTLKLFGPGILVFM